MNERFETFCKQARDGEVDDADFLLEMKNHIAMVIKKLKNSKKELLAGIRADISYQVGKRVNAVIKEMNRLREIIRNDMKKWSAQRADM